MLGKLIAFLLAAVVVNVPGMRLAYADSKEEKQARYAEKIKVLKLGVGESTGVKGVSIAAFLSSFGSRLDQGATNKRSKYLSHVHRFITGSGLLALNG